jgi:hypothetical protein
MAGASLVSMLATLNIDHIVNIDLYNYGLQFTTEWAVQYWTMTAIVFSMGWLIIITSVAFQLYLVVHRLHRPPEPEDEAPVAHEELVQNETPRIETKPSDKPEKEEVKGTAEEEVKGTAEEEVKGTAEEEVKTTALAVRTEDDLSEFRVLLEEISVMTNAPVTRQKADYRQTDEK